MTKQKKEIQLIALQLGFKNPKQYNASLMLKTMLKENNCSETEEQATKMLNKVKHLLSKKEYIYWCKMSNKLKETKK